MENKYYTPKTEEFHIGFKFELRNTYDSTDEDYNIWRECTIKDSHTILRLDSNFEEDYEHLLSNIEYELNKGDIRVKYLDKSDIESCGFKKTYKNQWIGWNDYYSGNISGEYGYFLFVTLHVPVLYTKSSKLEDNFFKIIVHGWFNSDIESTTSIEDKLQENESEVVYKGLINNLSEFKQVLKMIGVV